MPRIIQFSEIGGPEVLQFVEIDTPVPNDDEVLIRVKALGLNRAESMYRRNNYIIEAVLPGLLGTEAAGIVEAVGKNVTHVKVGDRVNTVPAFSMGDFAIYGEVIAMPGYTVIKQPDGLSFEEAASLWVMFLTPYGALIEDAKIQPGEPVLISAASSSTGIAAIQLANLAGAIPIALTRTSAKRQRLLDAGAKHVIPFAEVDLVEEVKRITDGKGVRVTFDPVGGELLPKLMQVMPWQGILYIYGALEGDTTIIPVLTQIGQMVTIKGWMPADIVYNRDRLQVAVDYITAALSEGKLSPVIDRIFPFDEMVEAHRYLESAQQFGKIVVKVD
ncbi:zinc-dependent alcohol dehydrogenase family protein [Shinella yambaruensis]|uniref:NADPH:quinone reductase n=1 Tax=Shinella yambaruensis TaxID=415996 RepID=A0ABQ5ZRP8_9HYPH|nr:zinc-dependent alcohol dehydrogenase family protein [Shinella yambaruensis]MCJ8028379.1 zinc-dependent alcohol dehydrogenase family protein [Shinella yambaruensis]MCU7981432.1 zinc-dependent alcohol dehydrogenase family protein [Shinella yambaruensis]GLR53538.1 NADPH:quinone reductase [Shinella yambaruensis]